jgi:DDE superfamily endonuclease
MEDVLDVYQRPLDEKRPLVCLDEASKQLLSDARPGLALAPGRVARQDSEYVRNGTASLFMVSAPLLGWRHVEVTDRRTCEDFAQVIKTLVDEQFAEADKIVLVLDNLNTHTPASLYKAFAPAEAKRLADKLEVHYTPKHGSWLNMAEIELSVLARQCLGERMDTKASVKEQVAVWEDKRNGSEMRIDWRFTTADARIKLKRLYPSILP